MSVGPRYEYEVSTQLLGLATHCAKMMIQQPGQHQPSANMQLSREQEPFIVSCHTKLRGPHGRSAFKYPVSNAVDCDVMLGPGDGMAIQPTVRLVSLVSLVQTRPSTATSWSPTTTLYPSLARCEAAVSGSVITAPSSELSICRRVKLGITNTTAATPTLVSCRYCAAASLSCFVVSKSFKIR